ncbi:hypothetical protein RHSIM_RhsimUnG0073600 [Rhododendron simsii]|uniref:C2 domain-containing protein n=1 Tax=Rhododendron simsii TaxID=118357 RepID=A0A834FW81_RHOSS|nr:hypothetical protein RHSIM_RhsimUnG0073600 [Rhododendron simsii]
METIAPKDMGRRFIYQLKRLVLCRREATKLYATVDLDKARVGRTRLIENMPLNPCWNESFLIYCAHTVSEVLFTVKDDNPIGATLIGGAYLPVTDIISGCAVDRWIQILDEDHVPVLGGSRIHVLLQFLNVTRDRNWSQGIKNPFVKVPCTFFMQRKGCRVTLYQDAHVPDVISPDFHLSGVDVSYGGENGFNQAIELSSEILLNVNFIQEKRLMGKYFGHAENFGDGKRCHFYNGLLRSTRNLVAPWSLSPTNCKRSLSSAVVLVGLEESFVTSSKFELLTTFLMEKFTKNLNCNQ